MKRHSLWDIVLIVAEIAVFAYRDITGTKRKKAVASGPMHMQAHGTESSSTRRFERVARP